MKPLEMPLETAKALTDGDISAAVDFLLARKQGVAAHLIDVATHQGTVTLAGHVDSMHMRERAEEIAATVRGVCAVENTLAVCACDIPDAALRHHVEEALVRHAAGAAASISCTAHDGTIMLLGQVKSWAEKQQVLRVAQGVRGVRDIEDHLSYRPAENPAARSEAELTAAIEHLLAWDHHIKHALIEVIAEKNGSVQLRGKVGSAAERRRAIATAWLAGAARVDAAELRVTQEHSCQELHQDKYSAKADEEIRQAIETRFSYHPRLRAAAPRVVVKDGRVTLAGLVGSLAARRHAEQEARGVVGVWQVSNSLRVRPPVHVEDATLQQAIREALAHDPYLHFSPVEVVVLNRRAILRGAVDSHFEKMHAEEVAATVDGLIALENRLLPPDTPTSDRDYYATLIAGGEGMASGPPSDAEVERRIQQQLFWSAHLHNQEVDVRVEKGVATLSGSVATDLDRKSATLCAYEGGATSIDNQLLTQFGPPH